jgi:hypothetical protein
VRRWLLVRGNSTRYLLRLAIEKEPSRFTLFEVQAMAWGTGKNLLP